jgi:ABC-type Fe3+-hydroxamate transport system substrate-binding protein
MSNGGRVPSRMNRRSILALLIGLLAVTACRRTAPTVSSEPPGPRIVALSPAMAIMLRDLGVADRVVGRHGWDMVLDKSIPVCGDQAGIDYEALLRADPTDILLEWGSRPLPERLEQLTREHDWRVLNRTLLTLDDLTGAAETVQDRFAPGAPSLAQRMTEAWSPRTGLFAGRVLLLLSADPPAALGPGSFHQQILERLGGIPAVTEGKPYITMDAEDVLRLAPEAIILIAPRSAEAPVPEGRADPEKVRAMLGRLGELDIPAVRDGRMALIDDPLSLTPSSAMIGFADELARILQAWRE